MITLKEALQLQIDRVTYELNLDINGVKYQTNYNYFLEDFIDRVKFHTKTGIKKIVEEVTQEKIDHMWEYQQHYTLGEERKLDDKDLFIFVFRLENDIMHRDFIYFPLRKLDEYNEKYIVDYSHYFNVEQGIPNVALKDTEEAKKIEIANNHFISEKKFIEEIPWKENIKKHLLDLTDQ